MRDFKLWNNIAGWVVFAVATISYLVTMEPTTSLWDCSEFIATSYKLEVGHPPGAPLFMLLARVASLFAPTPQDVPMMINGMNCIASGLCIMFLFWTITHLVRRIVYRTGEAMPLHKSLLILGAGAIGALSYAYTDTFWFSAVEGEVYALSSMFTAMVVWLMLKWEENADRPTAMRWIILIAYLMGLSIGVHILNLLTIPALVMIWFFRRYECVNKLRYVLMMGAALLVSFLILGAINGIIIPYTVALGAAFDTFAVNSLGMPVNAGMILFVVLVFAGLGALIWFTHSRRYRILNAVTLAVTVILIGFGSYAAVAIRANANPPMNSNNPSNPHALLSLLNRDQYGNRPLAYGPYYSASPIPMIELNPDVTADDQYLPTGEFKAKTMTWLNPETGKYEERDIFDDYVYPSEANALFPRMWFHSRAKQYEAEWVELKDGHPTKAVSNGEDTWYEPTASEDIAYFLDYQLGDMFVRYFLWNFVGRQDDIQLTTDAENGIYLHGGWLSGIDFIDELFTGPTDNLPSEQANNRARNTYFFLPLLLGMLGIIYQMSSDWRNFIIVSLLFVMMGVALVVYFNTAPGEPRERDYVYAGAFYAFSIWIGLGAAALGHLISTLFTGKSKSRMLPTAGVVVGLLFAVNVPVVLAVENWDDHDRSERYYARDLGLNYLNTAPQNAILLNYGDNDTFPLWYCQEVEGVRPDVRVVNTSYLGGEWYIDEMKLAANNAEGAPFTIPSDKYSFVNDFIIVAEPIDLLLGEGNVSMRAKVRSILNDKTYNIYMPDTGMEEALSYDSLEELYYQAQQIFMEYDSSEFYAYLIGAAEVPASRMQAFAEYQFAMLILEEVEYNKEFLEDMRAVSDYERKYRKMANADIYLKDAIRLFVHDGASLDRTAAPEERALLLVVNNNVMRIVENDSDIAPEERGADFEIMGRINPKADNFIDGKASDYILAARNYRISVDKDAAIAAGIVEEGDRARMLDEISITIGSSYLSKDYLMMLDLLAHFDWKRPLAFTQPYIMKDYGISQYARYDGFCYTLVPIRTDSRGSNVGYLDHKRLYPLFMGEATEGRAPLAFGNITNEEVLCDYFTRFNISATRIREGFTRVAAGFVTDGNYATDDARYADNNEECLAYVEEAMESFDKAIALLNRGIEVLPNKQVEYTYENTYPYIHAYYTVASSRMVLALDEYGRAIELLNKTLGLNKYPAEAYDDIEYIDNHAAIYNELLSTAQHRGITADSDNLYALALKHGANAERLSAAYEEAFMLGDKVGAGYIAARGEWAKYYLQFCTLDSFSTTINRELNFAVMDIIDVLKDASTLAGSYDWLANPRKGEELVANPLQFDTFVREYVRAISKITPNSERDPKFGLLEAHIFNIYSIYYYLDRSPQLGYEGPEALYHKEMVKFLNRKEVKAMIQTYANEYGMEVLEVI